MLCSQAFTQQLSLNPFKPYSALLVTSYCALRRKDRFCALHAQWEKGRYIGRGHPQGDMHMVAARLGCQSAMVGTGWANSCPGCMDRLRKRYSHLVGANFWQGRLLGL